MQTNLSGQSANSVKKRCSAVLRSQSVARRGASPVGEVPKIASSGETPEARDDRSVVGTGAVSSQEAKLPSVARRDFELCSCSDTEARTLYGSEASQSCKSRTMAHCAVPVPSEGRSGAYAPPSKSLQDTGAGDIKPATKGLPACDPQARAVAYAPFKKRSQPLKMGVIGVGNMGRHHARVLSLLKDIELIGVSDINLARGIEIASQYQTHFYKNYEDMLPALDAVCIAVPTKLHHEVGVRCLQAGVHVLIEKPIAASICEAESLVNLAAETGCILQVGHIERFNPAFTELNKVIQTESILALEARRLSPYSNRANDVSVVLDLMIHDIDLLLELSASPVVKLTSSGSTSSSSGNLDYVTANLGFANGVVATLTASKITHRKIRCLSAHCKNSLIETDFLTNEILIHRHQPANLRAEQTLYQQDGITERVYTTNIEPIYAEIEHFVNCIRGGERPSVGGEQALKALRLASSIEQMALDGQIWHNGRQSLVDLPSMSIL